MAKQVRYHYTVTGPWRYSFAYDMLRYDQAWPASEVEAGKLDALSRERPGRVGFSNTWAIQLIGLNYPTVARWESFGWTVGNVRKMVS